MRPEQRDLGLIWDMRVACRDVLEVTEACTLEDLQGDRIRQLALERAIEILGEAARDVSEAMRERYPDVEWEAIAKQRHVIAHDYGSIDHVRLWRVAHDYVPELHDRLDGILAAEGDAAT